jgi:amino acid adenylation domain-containing protein
MLSSNETLSQKSAINSSGETDASVPHTANNPSLMARIASYAAEFPDRTAVVDGSSVLSYGQFDARANQLAAYLLQLGIGPGSTAVLLFDRSADFVIAALAAMKAGSAYVPMDSATPADRLALVMEDSGAQILLTHRGKARGMTIGQSQVVEVDGPPSATIANQPHTSPLTEYSEDNLAYLVYTSGSTGRPKGVEITHGNVNCLIEWHQTAFGLTPADRASHVAGLGFDVVTWELWPNLTAGAALHIADETTRRSPEELRQWILDQQITVTFAPTVLAEQLLQMEWPRTAALRWMLTGGEALHRRPSVHFPFSFANCYGPAECTVVATSCRVSPGGNETPTIGKAIPRTSALILDDQLQPVAIGEPGELCLAGAHVGRGYRKNPELTAHHFAMYSPTHGGAPIRIYRTGDRARQLDNGEFVFLGRLDDQVKIRGYRIEPGEISSWLDKLPSIKKSDVIAHNGENGPELVAYLVSDQSATPKLAELRAYLASKVPDYMIPAQFVVLPAFPTTVNGKIDKKSLPLPTAANTLRSDNGANGASVKTNASANKAATSDLEDRISTIIAALLGQPSVKFTDNFFMLGGHSMLGVQLVAKIRDAFGVKLTLRQLFGAPTVNALCAEIRRLTAAQQAQQKR